MAKMILNMKNLFVIILILCSLCVYAYEWDTKSLRIEKQIGLISIEYPVFKGEYSFKINNAINQKVNAKLDAFKTSDAYVATLYGYYKIYFESENRLSFSIFYFAYNGGERPFQIVDTFSFVNNNRITANDFVTNKEGLKELLVEKIKAEKKNRGFKPTVDLMLDSYVEDFVLTENGVTWIFPAGLMGVFKEGEFEIFLTWEELKGVANKI